MATVDVLLQWLEVPKMASFGSYWLVHWIWCCGYDLHCSRVLWTQCSYDYMIILTYFKVILWQQYILENVSHLLPSLFTSRSLKCTLCRMLEICSLWLTVIVTKLFSGYIVLQMNCNSHRQLKLLSWAGIKRYRDLFVYLSVPWHSCLGYRHAGCLQLSHCQPREMCRLPTDVDLPRLLPPSYCHWWGAYHLPPLGQYLVCFYLLVLPFPVFSCWFSAVD